MTNRYTLLFVVVVLSGCSDAVEPSPGVRRLDVSTSRRIETFDDKMLAASARLPGFAGFYIDEGGSLVVNMAAEVPIAAVRTEVENLLREIRPGPIGANSELLGSLKIRTVRYNFQQLRSWYDVIAPLALSLRDVTMGDVDEFNNQIAFTVSSIAGQDWVNELAAKAMIPSEALRITYDLRRNHAASDTLDKRVRPIVGGVAFQTTATANSCTIAFNTTNGTAPLTDTNEYFLTVAHCTPQFGTVDNSLYGAQPTTGSHDTITVAEVSDPSLFTNSSDSNCPVNRNCRYSDAAVLRYSISSWTHGEVAWPAAFSKVFSTTKSVLYAGDPIYGENLYKIGRVTGQTSGLVTNTCASYQFNDAGGNDTGITLLCQAVAGLGPQVGDSGSPVVRLDAQGYLTAVGILNYTSGGFSVINSIGAEVGYNYCANASCR